MTSFQKRNQHSRKQQGDFHKKAQPSPAPALTEGIPSLLYEKLTSQYGEEVREKILSGFHAKRAVTLRVNTLKAQPEEICQVLTNEGISYERVPYSREALILSDCKEARIQALPLYEEGKVYLQSLSSMLPPILLNPQEQETILDMAAAPGGKTTQMAALTKGKAQITACEKNPIRADRLKYNLAKQGASQVLVMVTDARQLDDFFSFDRILLDAPCTGSGTISLAEGEGTYRLTKDYLDKTVKTQEILLKKALTLLKPGHEMIYSTCSILAEENEDLVSRVLRGTKAELVPLDSSFLPQEALLPVKLPGVLCLCPNEDYEGFFVAKIRKTR